MNIQTPILFIVFNRPDITQITFDAIKAVKPQKLYVAADGAREFMPTDVEKCAETRKIIEQVDWECKVRKLYRDENAGVERAIISAIDWFFENEKMGVIFEDDCVPSLSFFKYSELLLKKYEEDERIMFISGSNFVKVIDKVDASYYFSKFGSGWGWATWKRAWLEFNVNLIEEITEEEFRDTIRSVTSSDYHFNYFVWLLGYHRTGKEKNWDWRLTFYTWYKNKFVINPSLNLISNIGYGEQATSSKGKNKNRNKLATLSIYDLEHIVFNDNISLTPQLEERILNIYNPPLTLFQKFKRLIPANIKAKIKTILFGKS